MKTKLIILVATLLATLTAVAQSATEKAFAEALAAKSHTIESISCRFEQSRSMQILASEVKKEGTFNYLRPECIRLVFDDGDYILMTDSQFRISSAGVEQAVRIQANPMLKELKRILSACMTGDVSALAAGFAPTISDEGATYRVELKPTRGRMSARMHAIVMLFDKASMSLSMLRMEEASGDSTTYRFYDKKFNCEVAADLFN
ncbi:MAG: outer membrane lipoprotein carrier protein LolA [Rikenellaceae bacterium]|nr:outer membrane lipoprotein carrier protein LolA [Rikenellaceae bacterium]